MNIHFLILSTFLSFLVIFDLSERVECQCPVNLKLLCYEQTTCGDCMRAHYCCHWCYDQKNFNGTHRCNFIEELEVQCGNKIEKNKLSNVNIIKDEAFSRIEKAEDATNAIQLKPQSFQVTLRQEQPVNLTFTYQAAKNYPLDLYYLGDLSYSMRTHLETLQSLGDALGNSLANLTEHYRLAYGSFLDKPGMPFIYTDQKNLQNPCLTLEKCEQAYLFKHRLNFTKTTERFFEEVRKSKISANVDDLDGALDAIFQILVCNRSFGWSEYSRKIILLSTDSLLHTAGDGILAGATAVNYKELCLVNSTGDFTEPLKYDYPSLGQIKYLLGKYKVSLIVAVTKDKIESYKKMERDILDQEAFVGELETDSKNILNLVKSGYSDFLRKVEFSADVDDLPELEVKFFAHCGGDGGYNVSSACYNVETEKPLSFKLQLTLKEFTSKTSQHIVIKEKTINEKIDININYVGNCECSGYDNTNTPRCDHGNVNCGDCNCEPGWTGETCSDECKNEPRACRSNETDARTCSQRGDCECSKCICQSPYVGEFCQYDCPTNKYGQICNGHGTCLEGKCACNVGYTKDDCSCETSTDKCRFTEDKICSGHGLCECNKCDCEDEYQGTYCEIKDGQNNFCEVYESYIKEYAQNKTRLFKNSEGDILIEESEQELKCSDMCSIIVFEGTQRCFMDYCYHSGENSTVHLVTNNKSCIYTAQAVGLGTGILIVFTTLLAGAILIALKKWQIHKADLAEYQRFLVERNKWEEMKEVNPIYKSPVSEFTNPMAR